MNLVNVSHEPETRKTVQKHSACTEKQDLSASKFLKMYVSYRSENTLKNAFGDNMFLRCTECVQLSAHLYSIKHVWEKLHWRYFLDLIKNVRPSLVCGQGITRRESLGQNVHTLDPCKYLVLYFQI